MFNWRNFLTALLFLHFVFGSFSERLINRLILSALNTKIFMFLIVLYCIDRCVQFRVRRSHFWSEDRQDVTPGLYSSTCSPGKDEHTHRWPLNDITGELSVFHRILISVLSLLSVDLLQHTLIPDHSGIAQEDAGIRCGIKRQLFPENIDRVPSVKADLSIPALHNTVTEEVRIWSNPDPDPAECSLNLLT